MAARSARTVWILAVFLAVVAGATVAGNTSANACDGMSGGACSLFRMINAHREARGLHRLKPLKTCVNAARYYATELRGSGACTTRRVRHRSARYSSFRERMNDFGVTDRAAEILHCEPGSSAKTAFVKLIRSRGHRNIIESRNYYSAGAAMVGGFWVQCFSAAGDPNAEAREAAAKSRKVSKAKSRGSSGFNLSIGGFSVGR